MDRGRRIDPNKPRVIILALVLLCTVRVIALDSSKTMSQYVLSAWQTEQGLPQNSVQAIAQTKDGYLWLGTQEGLARFDGVRFAIFDKSNTPALQSNNVQSLLADGTGGLWIGTESGLLHLVEGRYTRYTTAQGLPNDSIRSLGLQRNGTLWVGTGQGVARLRGETFRSFGRREGLPGAGVQAICEDGGGTVWIATTHGLCSISEDVVTPYLEAGGPGRDRLYCLQSDVSGGLWIGSESQGLFHLKDGVFKHYGEAEGLTHQMVYALASDRDGALWLGTYGGGLARLKGEGFETLTSRTGLSNDVVISLFEDREGNLWAGTVGGGVNRFSDGAFTPIGAPEGLPDDMVSCLLGDQSGSVWLGTYGAGLCRIDKGRVTVLTKRQGLLDDNVYSLYSDKPSSLWIGTGAGVNHMDDGRLTAFTKKDGLADNTVYAITATSDGALWFATGGGLSRYQGGRFESFGEEERRGLPSSTVVSLLGARDGSLWIGTYKGLVHYKDGLFTTYGIKEGLSQQQVMSLYEDAAGALWVGTYGGGLNRFKDGKWAALTTRQGLFDDVVYTILADERGSLWMTCNKGVYCASKKDLDAAADGVTTPLICRVFGKADGMRTSECNGGTQPCGWMDKEGRLWFPTVKGAVRVDPASALAPQDPPPVIIESVLYDKHPFDLGPSTVDLPPGEGSLEIQYTAMTLKASQRVTFRYRLEGFEQGWNNAGGRRTAYYTNIPPGRYVFRVAAARPDGSWGESGGFAAFRIRPHFYQTYWFYGLCLIAALLAGWLLYLARIGALKARERELVALVDERTHSLQMEKERAEKALAVVREQEEKLEELDRLKTRFFANVSHEFRTPLTLILGPLEEILSGAMGSVRSELAGPLSMMLRNGRTLLRLINQLLDISKLEAGRMEIRARRSNLVAFLRSVVHSFTPLAEKQGIELAFDPQCPECQVYFDPEKMEKIIYNLLSNAFKFTPAGGRVRVGLRAAGVGSDGRVEVWVEDTGPGIAPDQLQHVFERFYQAGSPSGQGRQGLIAGTGIGLALAKDLALLHGGDLQAFSEAGSGAKFVLSLRAGRDHLTDDQIEEAVAPEEVAGGLTFIPEQMKEADGPESMPKAQTDRPPAGDSMDTVLVVEDNSDVRAYVRGFLSNHFRVFEADNGESGLNKALAAGPDLIISDVMMPVMDGYELCRAVKSDPRLDHTPVILLTAKASQDNKVEGLEVGADDYLPKPFDARELLARARNLIQMRRQEKLLKSFNEELERKVREQLEIIIKNKRLTKYFPKRLVERILLSDEDVNLSSERRLITVFFTDLSGFTALTEKTEPEDITAFLNEYLTEMATLIEADGGTLARFMGDGILGFFGAIDEMPAQEQAARAVHMGLAMQRRLDELKGSWTTRGIQQELKLRIGINQDHLTVGNFGAPDHMEYTALGRGINLAKRFEAACTPGRLLVSARIAALTSERFPYGPRQERTFKGVASPVPVHELDPSDVPAGA